MLTKETLLTIEYRCGCGGLLFRGLVLRDLVEIKCRRCKQLHYFHGLAMLEAKDRFAILTDFRGMIINAHQAIQTHLLEPVHRVVGTAVSSLFVSEREAEADAALAARVRDHKYVRYDAMLRTKDRAPIATTISYRHLCVGGRNFVLRVVDRAQTGDASDIPEQTFSKNDICALVVEANGTGTILYVDRRSKSVLGFEPEEMILHHAKEFTAPEEYPLRRRNRLLLVDRLATFRQHGYLVRTKAGEYIPFDIYATPFYDQGGEFIGYRNLLWHRNPLP